MSVKIIQERLDSYHCQSEQEELFALKEISQEIALAALSRGDFFQHAAFQGGTALRILHTLERFSEDLDFILQRPGPKFSWVSYFKNLEIEFSAYGLEIRVEDRSKVEESVKKLFLKDDSIGKILILKNKPRDKRMAMIKIKFEVDTNPPPGSRSEIRYPDFPYPFPVAVQDLPSLFGGKSHALLCRSYTKGRDWYDFVWYVSRKIVPNFEFLSNACDQQGPWKGKKIAIDPAWYFSEFEKKINATDWNEAKQDVMRFLRPRNLPMLDLWGEKFFLEQLDKIRGYLG
jgi:hypothetical protein